MPRPTNTSSLTLAPPALRRAALFLSLALGLAAAPIAAVAQAADPAQPAWETFEQPGYGFRLDVPDHLFDRRVKRPKTSRVIWTRRDGAASLEAFARPLPLDLTPEALLAERQAARPERVITYEASGEGWAVTSGFETEAREEIFYERLERGEGRRWAGFVLRWRPEMRDQVDDLVGPIGRSLAVLP